MVTIVSEEDLITKKDCDKHVKLMTDKLEQLSGLAYEVKSLNDHFSKDGIITEIRDHVKDTNGKVALNTKWRNYMFAFVIMFSFLFPTLTGVFIYFMKDMKHDISNEITLEINKAINTYDKQIFE